MMKKFIATIIFTLAASTAAYAVLPPVLATVNGTDITKAEIEKAFANMAMDQPGQEKMTFEKTPADFQKAFVEKYAEKLLIVEAAKKAKLQDDPEIKQKLKDAEEFLIQQKFLTDLVMRKKNDEALKKIYDEKLKNKAGKDEVHAMHILVKTESEAKKIKQSLDDGANFEETAKHKSIEPGAKMSGGDLGYFTEDQMVPEFSKAAFSLKKGEISQPVQSTFGWHIIKMINKRPKKIPTFAESKPALEKAYTSEMIEDEVKRLKVAADIKYFGSLAKEPAKPAVQPVVKKVDDKKPEEKKSEDKKSEEKKPEDKKIEEKKPEDKKPEKKANEVKPEEKQVEEKKADKPKEKKAEIKKPDAKTTDKSDESKAKEE